MFFRSNQNFIRNGLLFVYFKFQNKHLRIFSLFLYLISRKLINKPKMDNELIYPVDPFIISNPLEFSMIQFKSSQGKLSFFEERQKMNIKNWTSCQEG